MTEKKINYLGWTVAAVTILTQVVTAVWLIAVLSTKVDQIQRDVSDIKLDHKDYNNRIESIELFDGMKKR